MPGGGTGVSVADDGVVVGGRSVGPGVSVFGGGLVLVAGIGVRVLAGGCVAAMVGGGTNFVGTGVVGTGVLIMVMLVTVGTGEMGEGGVKVGNAVLVCEGVWVAVLATTAEVVVLADMTGLVATTFGVEVLVAPITLPAVLHHQ